MHKAFATILGMLLVMLAYGQKHLVRTVDWQEQPEAQAVYQAQGILGYRIDNFLMRGDSSILSDLTYFVQLRADGRLLMDSATSAQGFTNRLLYNETGQLTGEVRRFRKRKSRTRYHYRDRVFCFKEENLTTDTTVGWTFKYDYDDEGRLARAIKIKGRDTGDTTSVMTFFYNDKGQLERKVNQNLEKFSFSFEYLYEYDNSGRLKMEWKKGGDKQQPAREWVYNEDGTETALIDHRRKERILYQYQNGLLKKKTFYGNGGAILAYSEYTYQIRE